MIPGYTTKGYPAISHYKNLVMGYPKTSFLSWQGVAFSDGRVLPVELQPELRYGRAGGTSPAGVTVTVSCQRGQGSLSHGGSGCAAASHLDCHCTQLPMKGPGPARSRQSQFKCCCAYKRTKLFLYQYNLCFPSQVPLRALPTFLSCTTMSLPVSLSHLTEID